jgi:hypothetical protein
MAGVRIAATNFAEIAADVCLVVAARGEAVLEDLLRRILK